MKFFISVDMEGISGIVDGSMVSRKQGDYEGGRKLMAADATASILIPSHFEHVPRLGCCSEGGRRLKANR